MPVKDHGSINQTVSDLVSAVNGEAGTGIANAALPANIAAASFTASASSPYVSTAVPGGADISAAFRITGGAPWFDVTHPTYGGAVAGQWDVAINAALAAASSAATVISSVLIPPGIYSVAGTIVWPSNVTVWAYGAEIQNNIAAAIVTTSAFGVSNLRIFGLLIDGNKGAFGATAVRHGLQIDDSTNVVLRDVTSQNNRGDGFRIAASISSNHCTGVFMYDCIGTTNDRQGLTITDLTLGRFYNCQFLNSSGQAPQCGIDIEPNFDASNVTDLRFNGCLTTGCAGEGVQVLLRAAPSGTQAGIHFIGHKSNSNAGDGYNLQTGTDIHLIDCEALSNTVAGITTPGTVSDIFIVGGRVALNGTRGLAGITSGTVTNLRIFGTKFEDNSATTPNAVDGIRLSGGTMVGVRLVGVVSTNRTTSNQRFGISSASSVSYLSISEGDYNGNATGASSLGDDATTRNVWAARGLVTYGISSVITAPAPLTGQTAAVASIAALTSPNDGVKHVYRVSGTVTITTLGSGAINLEVTYTDEAGQARTCIIPVCAEAGAFAAVANAADAWKGEVTIVTNPNTVVTVLTAGTFTGCTYNTSAQIQQLL